MTRGTGQRLYRACQRCRKRKTKCDLNSMGVHRRPPCAECSRTGVDCVLAGSRRGGNFTQFRKPKNRSRQEADDLARRLLSVSRSHPSAADGDANSEAFAGNESDDEAMCDELKNPFDALQILAKAAVQEDRSSDQKDCSISSEKSTLDPSGNWDHHANSNMHPENVVGKNPIRTAGANRGIESYELVANGTLDVNGMSKLLQIYKKSFHAFVPLVPKAVLNPRNMDQSVENECFLLTAILTIASKDDLCLEVVHRNCWQYMKKLLLHVLLGLPSARRIGSVEGLLLLSEWVPYIQQEQTSSWGIQRGSLGSTEDSAAWSLVGQAVRQAYLLRLDRTSFRQEIFKEPKELVNRKRLVWTYVYLADRQISVRMGQSFWSRGPSLSTKFTVSDFPNLQPESNTEDDLASVLQATVELTQLLHNAHDILYTSKSRTLEIMLMGDYSRYLDDFLKALISWDQVWGTLEVSPKLKYSLRFMYEYLCLYVNAFSLQAVISRSFESQGGKRLSQTGTQALFLRGIMASPDGRFVFESIRAAKTILKIFSEMNAVEHIRYLPSRFYVYGIYSAVFLYRAKEFGALDVTNKNEEVIKLVQQFMTAIESAASSGNHIGQRYSKLLESLWFPAPRPTLADAQMTHLEHHNSSMSIGNTTQTIPIPNLIEIPQFELEAQDSVLEPTNFDPFWSGFSGFEVDVFGFMPPDDFSFQALN